MTPRIEVIYKIHDINTEQGERADKVGDLITTQATQTWETHRGYVKNGGLMPSVRDAIADDAWRASLEQELKTARDAVSRARREATA